MGRFATSHTKQCKKILKLIELFRKVCLKTPDNGHFFRKIVFSRKGIGILRCTPIRIPNPLGPKKKAFTLPETNIASENEPLEKEIPIGNLHF